MDLEKHDNFYYLASPWISSKEIPDLDHFLVHGRKKVFKKGEFITNTGDIVDKLYILVKGRIKLMQQGKNGLEKTYWLMKGPGIFGEVPFFHQCSSRCFFIAEETSEVYLFDRDIISRELPRYPRVMFHLLRTIAQKMRVMTFQMEDMSFYNPIARVARLLFLLAYQNGEKTGEGYIIKEKLTHQEIANITGLHRVTTTNALKKLTKEGIVIKNRDEIIVPNLEHLYEWILNHDNNR
ncbi:MAG: Crp/Fnr family transcriptional regulator [Peptococcaceae bacterium]